MPYSIPDPLDGPTAGPVARGHDDTVEGVREELELGIELVGADAVLTSLL